MPREFNRNERIAAQIKRELAAILQNQIKDPRLGMVTVNAVDIGRDLAVAKVYVTNLKYNNSEQKSEKILNQAASYIRRELAKRMRMRNIPELRFLYDDSLERGNRLAAIFNELK